jgi:hypothetical protein
VGTADAGEGLAIAQPGNGEDGEAAQDHRSVMGELRQDAAMIDPHSGNQQGLQHAGQKQMHDKTAVDQLGGLRAGRNGGVADHVLVDDHIELVVKPGRGRGDEDEEHQARLHQILCRKEGGHRHEQCRNTNDESYQSDGFEDEIALRLLPEGPIGDQKQIERGQKAEGNATQSRAARKHVATVCMIFHVCLQTCVSAHVRSDDRSSGFAKSLDNHIRMGGLASWLLPNWSRP